MALGALAGSLNIVQSQNCRKEPQVSDYQLLEIILPSDWSREKEPARAPNAIYFLLFYAPEALMEQ